MTDRPGLDAWLESSDPDAWADDDRVWELEAMHSRDGQAVDYWERIAAERADEVMARLEEYVARQAEALREMAEAFRAQVLAPMNQAINTFAAQLAPLLPPPRQIPPPAAPERPGHRLDGQQCPRHALLLRAGQCARCQAETARRLHRRP